jgi:hypothetical protein
LHYYKTISVSVLLFNKYKAVRTHCGLHSHMSKGEAEFCNVLQLEERAGVTRIVKLQPNVLLTEAKIRIIPDWLVFRIKSVVEEEQIYIDFKGYDSQSWKRNRKLWKHYGPAPMEVWKKNSKGFYLHEVINV